MGKLTAFGILIVATILEAGGDAIVRKALGEQATGVRIGLFLAGAVVLFFYGLTINLAPFDFGRVIGLYIATFFVVWQVTNLIVFGAIPTPSILTGGALIVAGGLIVTFWPPR
ncbi:MAG TPA: hypothetical protein VL899_03450 [Alphaproteobacteria bacterium]|nr:hypothetical protein [Alphaproteobacteria bacterium]